MGIVHRRHARASEPSGRAALPPLVVGINQVGFSFWDRLFGSRFSMVALPARSVAFGGVLVLVLVLTFGQGFSPPVRVEPSLQFVRSRQGVIAAEESTSVAEESTSAADSTPHVEVAKEVADLKPMSHARTIAIMPAEQPASVAEPLTRRQRRQRSSHLQVKLWEARPGEAPWYFPGASGGSPRAREQLQMRKNSGYWTRDSPLVSEATASRPLLTGTSWHHGRGTCPAGCEKHGTCDPTLGRCDCGPYHWGADCSVPVVTQKICVRRAPRA